MLTVYLDTSFYIDLERAGPHVAAVVADEFARLDIRPVVSNVLLDELLRRDGSGLQLLDRVTRLPEPLCIPNTASWVLLGLEGEDRADFIAEMRRHQQIMAQIQATSLGADRLNPAEARIVGERHNAPTEPGPEADAFTARMFEGALASLAPLEEMYVALAETDPRAAEVLGLLSELKQMLSGQADPEVLGARATALQQHPVIAQAARAAAIGSTLSKNDRRVVDVAVGAPTVTPKLMDGLVSLFGDAAHMHVFLENLDAIDYLQIDGARMSQLQRDAKHELRPVADRCFTAATLDAVLDVLEELRSRPAPTS